MKLYLLIARIIQALGFVPNLKGPNPATKRIPSHHVDHTIHPPCRRDVEGYLWVILEDALTKPNRHAASNRRQSRAGPVSNCAVPGEHGIQFIIISAGPASGSVVAARLRLVEHKSPARDPHVRTLNTPYGTNPRTDSRPFSNHPEILHSG
jgi:hypothetical protein